MTGRPKKNNKIFVNSILTDMFSRQLAVQMNKTGRNNKIPFGPSQFYIVIVKALTKFAKKMIIEQKIATWFRLSKNRKI